MSDIWDTLENEGHGESLEEEMFAWLSAYMDGETTPKERRLVEAYLREEPEAEAVLRLLQAAEAELAAESVDPPQGLREAILARTTRKPSLLPKTLRWAGGLATAGAMTAFLYAVLPDGTAHPAVDGSVASVAVSNEEPAVDRVLGGASESIVPEAAPPAKADANPEAALPSKKAEPRRAEFKPSVSKTPTARTDERRVETPNEQPTFVPASSPSRPAPVPASYERLPAAYASEEPVTVRSEPKPLDPAAMPPESAPHQDVTSSNRQTDQAKTSGDQQKVLPSARQKLRESLQKANQERAALTDDELNAPRKRISSN